MGLGTVPQSPGILVVESKREGTWCQRYKKVCLFRRHIRRCGLLWLDSVFTFESPLDSMQWTIPTFSTGAVLTAGLARTLTGRCMAVLLPQGLAVCYSQTWSQPTFPSYRVFQPRASTPHHPHLSFWAEIQMKRCIFFSY